MESLCESIETRSTYLLVPRGGADPHYIADCDLSIVEKPYLKSQVNYAKSAVIKEEKGRHGRGFDGGPSAETH